MICRQAALLVFSFPLSCDLIGQVIKTKHLTSLSAFVIRWTFANFCTFQSIVVWRIKCRRQRFLKIVSIPNTVRPPPTGLRAKICGRGWEGEKIRRVWTHTLSRLFFVVFDFSVGFCRMGESISCTLGRHMPGKIRRLLAPLASSVVPMFSCALLCLCTALKENKQRHHRRLFLQFLSHFLSHRRETTNEQHTSASQKRTPNVEALITARLRLWLAQMINTAPPKPSLIVN